MNDMSSPNGVFIDNAAYPLFDALVSYDGISTAAGAATGLTIVCLNLVGKPSFKGQIVKPRGTSPCADQVRFIVADTTAGTITVDKAFTNSAGVVQQIVAGTQFDILSFGTDYSSILYSGTSTGAGALDGSTIVDTGLAAKFTEDDQCIGTTVRIVSCTTASLIGQEREVYDYDFGTTTIYFDTPFTSQVPIATGFEVIRGRPSSSGGPGPQP
jgi:hypothetical protein